jgi:hypothetical protein
MAGLGAEEFILYDTMPGPVNPNMSKPVNGFDSTHSCGTIAVYVPGTKIMSYQEVTTTSAGSRSANLGSYTCIYAQYVCATTEIDVTAGEIMTYSCGSSGAHGPLALTRDMSASNGAPAAGPCAIACVDVTPDGFGWYWCAGVCPQSDVTALDQSTFVTDGSVSQGSPLILTTGASHATLSCDISDNGTLCVGWALRADA